jgi:hypothetical protein
VNYGASSATYSALEMLSLNQVAMKVAAVIIDSIARMFIYSPYGYESSFHGQYYSQKPICPTRFAFISQLVKRLKFVDPAWLDAICSRLSQVIHDREELSSTGTLAREIQESFNSYLPDVKSALDRTLKLREKMVALLEQPATRYDQTVLTLYREIAPIPPEERLSLRHLLTDADRDALGPYPARANWLALEECSRERLISGLSIWALIFPDDYDYRDVMCMTAPTHVVAVELGMEPEVVFAEAARFAGPGVAETLLKFGKRQDVSLDAFGWTRVETPNGPRIRQAI